VKRLSEFWAQRKTKRLMNRIKRDWKEFDRFLVKTGWPRQKRRQLRRDLIGGTGNVLVEMEGTILGHGEEE